MNYRPMNYQVLKTSVLACLLTGTCLAETIHTTLDGQPLQFDAPPVSMGGRVMVPLRGIFESLGAEVTFESSTQSIKATKGSRIVELTLGKREALLNGQLTYLDVPASTVNGRTFVPLRFVSEALNTEVRWMPATSTVALTSPGASATQPANAPIQQAIAPKIQSVRHNASRALKSQEQLWVSLNGDPGAQASFDILGLVRDFPLREVSPGRYEAEYTVPSNLQIQRGELVGRLTRNGLSAEQEASRPLRFQLASNSSNGTPNANSSATGTATNRFTVYPDQGSVVSTLRPNVWVQLAPDLNLASAHLYLDGREVAASVSNGGLAYTPSLDLTPGTHRMTAQALDNVGRLNSRDWNFEINPYSSQLNSAGQPAPFLSVQNLGNGSTVPAVFNVQGTTSPYAMVSVQATSSQSVLPGFLNLQNQVASVQGQADASGHFDIALNASSVPINTALNVRITASDTLGRTSPETQLSLVRR